MKLQKTIILAVLLLISALSQKVLSQPLNPLISFTVESCNLDEALEKLFAEYELNVAFSKAELSKIRIEGYTCSYKSVEEVLTDLLKGTGYDFKKVGKQYVIRKGQQTALGPSEQPESVVTRPGGVAQKPGERVNNKPADTVRIIDTVQLIRTVMRYDTIVQVQTIHDTVYEVKYKGVAFPWPSFKDNGWFIAPALTICSLGLSYNPPETGHTVTIAPVSAYSVGLDGGYKYRRLSVGLSLSYKSLKYKASFDHSIAEGGYYVNDTLDTYYVVHPAGDTTYQYILDSTYIPLTTTQINFRDVNRMDYLSVGLFASFDFVKTEYFRVFVKAGLSADFPLVCSGSYFVAEAPYQVNLTKAQAESIKLTYFGGLGLGLKLGNHFELVPEVHYRQLSGSPYRATCPLELRLHSWGFRLGLNYYF